MSNVWILLRSFCRTGRWKPKESSVVANRRNAASTHLTATLLCKSVREGFAWPKSHLPWLKPRALFKLWQRNSITLQKSRVLYKMHLMHACTSSHSEGLQPMDSSGSLLRSHLTILALLTTWHLCPCPGISPVFPRQQQQHLPSAASQNSSLGWATTTW